MSSWDFSGLSWSAAKAFLIALVLTPIVRDVFRSYNVVDRPGRRKVHAYPIPRVGGIPIAIAYVTALLAFNDFPVTNTDSPVWKLLPGIAMIFFTGLIDDFFNLRPVVKLGGQILAAVLVFVNGLGIGSIAKIELPSWFSLLVTVFWLLLATNALNLIDGLDGLCAGMGFMATLTLFTASIVQSNYALAFATLPLAGALLGFLCFNFNPATVFLGDSGALTIGFLLGCYGILWTGKTATLISVIIPILALSVPLLDVSLSIVRRSLKSQPIFAADRGHIHHRLLDQGLSVRRTVLVLYIVAFLAAGFAILLTVPEIKRFQGVILVAVLLSIGFGIHQLRYSEFDMVRRLLFGGEFQQALAGKVRLEQLDASLKQAKNEEEWWKLLIAAGRDAGWSRIVRTGSFPHEKLLADTPVTWSFQVALSADDHIVIEGGSHPATGSLDLLGIAEVIRQSSPGRRSEGAPVVHS